jgi:hypothetical protein
MRLKTGRKMHKGLARASQEKVKGKCQWKLHAMLNPKNQKKDS